MSLPGLYLMTHNEKLFKVLKPSDRVSSSREIRANVDNAHWAKVRDAFNNPEDPRPLYVFPWPWLSSD